MTGIVCFQRWGQFSMKFMARERKKLLLDLSLWLFFLRLSAFLRSFQNFWATFATFLAFSPFENFLKFIELFEILLDFWCLHLSYKIRFFTCYYCRYMNFCIVINHYFNIKIVKFRNKIWIPNGIVVSKVEVKFCMKIKVKETKKSLSIHSI